MAVMGEGRFCSCASLSTSGLLASAPKGDRTIMKDATKRSIIRWIHIVFAIPILGYIYSPFEKIPNYARPTRFVFVPVMVLSGLWMWKGHVLRRLISKRSA
jgi:thiosulfate reductase cytochrome b subunit